MVKDEFDDIEKFKSSLTDPKKIGKTLWVSDAIVTSYSLDYSDEQFQEAKKDLLLKYVKHRNNKRVEKSKNQWNS